MKFSIFCCFLLKSPILIVKNTQIASFIIALFVQNREKNDLFYSYLTKPRVNDIIDCNCLGFPNSI